MGRYRLNWQRGLSADLLPMPLAQPNGEALLLTAYSGRGVAYPARLESLAIHGQRPPPLQQLKPLIGFKVKPFRLRFTQVFNIDIETCGG
jgi:hypothetical protein